MTRHETRETVFKLVFEKLFKDETIEEIVELAKEIEDLTINDSVIKTFTAIENHQGEIAEIIKKFSEKRQYDRIPKVNIAILKIAIYEIVFDNSMPTNIVINEAVIIAKKYAHKSDVSFINGVLGSFARTLEEK